MLNIECDNNVLNIWGDYYYLEVSILVHNFFFRFLNFRSLIKNCLFGLVWSRNLMLYFLVALLWFHNKFKPNKLVRSKIFWEWVLQFDLLIKSYTFHCYKTSFGIFVFLNFTNLIWPPGTAVWVGVDSKTFLNSTK